MPQAEAEVVKVADEEGELRSREDLPTYKEYELMARMYKEGGWVEEVEEHEQ